jgi:tRNA threonylcarbamoyl adenosine modification protein (Sua5/YciO/YrdC/YwlC family)
MNINTDFLSLNHPKAIQRALEVINNGGLIAFPTDTVYGIGASAYQEDAIQKIYQVKERSHLKAIPILISDTEELDLVAQKISPGTKKIINHYWPGPLTLVLPKQPALPDNLSQTNSIGVRVPDDNLTRELLRKIGPMAATSANLSGQPSALNASEVLEYLGGKIDLVLDGGPVQGGQASTVVDLTGEIPQLVREGPISMYEINQVIGI